MMRRLELHHFTAACTRRPRPTAVAAVVATALGVFVAPAAMSRTDTATASDVQNLKDQVQQLQRKIDAMQVPQAAAQSTPAAAAPSEGPGFQAGPVTVTFGGFTPR